MASVTIGVPALDVAPFFRGRDPVRFEFDAVWNAMARCIDATPAHPAVNIDVQWGTALDAPLSRKSMRVAYGHGTASLWARCPETSALIGTPLCQREDVAVTNTDGHVRPQARWWYPLLEICNTHARVFKFKLSQPRDVSLETLDRLGMLSEDLRCFDAREGDARFSSVAHPVHMEGLRTMLMQDLSILGDLFDLSDSADGFVHVSVSGGMRFFSKNPCRWVEIPVEHMEERAKVYAFRTPLADILQKIWGSEKQPLNDGCVHIDIEDEEDQAAYKRSFARMCEAEDTVDFSEEPFMKRRRYNA